MSNQFNKEERIAWEDILQGFRDGLVLSKLVRTKLLDQKMLERGAQVVWRPQPYVAQSFLGSDQTANFKPQTQLAVPVSIGIQRVSPWTMTPTELRDALQEERLGDAARQKIASDVNVAAMNVATAQGTLVVKRTPAATGFDDVAQCDAIMNRNGVQGFKRRLALSTGDYNGMAGNLAARQTPNEPVMTAYEEARIGRVASFDAYKLDYANRILAAGGGGGLTINTLVAGANFYTPRAVSVGINGETSNVDNRTQTVTVSSSTGVVAGDCCTFAGVNEAHHITKNDTGSLKTFRVISVTDATHIVISPPMISAQGNTDAELQYKNCVVTPSATAAIVFLNTAAASINPFWQEDAIELLPGRLAIPEDAGAAVMKGTIEQGLEIVMQRQYDIKTQTTFYRIDCLFGVACVQPEMCGIMLFGQP